LEEKNVEEDGLLTFQEKERLKERSEDREFNVSEN